MKVGIVGSGIIGMHAAWYLRKAGCEVSLFEKNEFSGGSSVSNAGMIVPSHFVPLATSGVIGQAIKWIFKKDSPLAFHPSLNPDLIKWAWKFLKASRNKDQSAENEILLKMNLLSRGLYEEIIRENNMDVGFQSKGLIMFCKGQQALDHEITLAERSRQLGVEAEILDAEGTKKLNPEMEVNVKGSVFYPTDAFFSTNQYISALKSLLIKSGVQIIENSPILKLISEKGKIRSLESNGKSFDGYDQVVITSGVFSSELIKSLGIKIPMVSGKGYSITVPNPPAKMEVCGLLIEGRVAMTPMNNGLRIGGTMEIGAKETGINQGKVNAIFKSVPEYFPEFADYDFHQYEVWSGLRPCSPDGMPYIGKPDGFENLFIATGHAMMGLSMGPVTGKIISKSLMDSNFQLNRFLDNERAEVILNPSRYR